MAVGTLYGVVTTAVAAGGLANKQLSGVIDARVKCHLDSYVTTGANEDATSTIAMCPTLPTGANIVGVMLSLSGALTSNVTLSVGDSASAARYLSVVACSAAIVTDMLGAYGVPGGLAYIVGTATGDNQILVTINAANNIVASRTIKIMILYTMD
jgi:hypothetical protein